MSDQRTLTIQDDTEREIARQAIVAHRAEKAEREAVETARAEKIEALRILGVSLGLGEEAKAIKVYPVYQNTDLEEGKGGSIAVGYFFTEDQALDAYASGVHGVWGTEPYHSDPLVPVEVYLTAADWREATGRKGH